MVQGGPGPEGVEGEGPEKRTCWICSAGFTDDHNCYDFSKSAAWRRSMTTMGDFYTGPEQFISRIWTIPGLNLQCIRPDWMHMCCLGVLQYLIGNCLWECFVDLGGVFTIPGQPAPEWRTSLR